MNKDYPETSLKPLGPYYGRYYNTGALGLIEESKILLSKPIAINPELMVWSHTKLLIVDGLTSGAAQNQGLPKGCPCLVVSAFFSDSFLKTLDSFNQGK